MTTATQAQTVNNMPLDYAITVARRALAVAAGVGEQEIEKLRHQLALDDEDRREMIDQINKLQESKAATIERCAQVAETVDDGECGYQHAKHIAAAIRAMKEKP